jgi:hypothetical protein
LCSLSRWGLPRRHIAFISGGLGLACIERMAATLQEMRDAIQSNSRVKFDPIQVYITKFDVSAEYPWKFVYKGCTVKKEDGYLCFNAIVGP